jgi:putative intracellular protease/amidase
MRRVVLLICISILYCIPVFCDTVETIENTPSVEARPAKTGYVLFIIPQYNFVDDEYTIPKIVISRAGYTVEVASESTTEAALGTDAIKVRPNFTVAQINTDRYDAVVFVGGYLSKKFYENPVLMAKTKEFKDKGRLICAMDNIPYFLAQWGLLKNIKATINPSMAREFKKMGANYVEKDIVIDKNFITVDLYRYSDDFAADVVDQLNLLK